MWPHKWRILLLAPAPSSPRDDRFQRYALWALIAMLAFSAVRLWVLLRVQPLGMDFLPLWTAGRFAWSQPDRVYDFAAVSHAQAWLLPGFGWLRPFANPPTALLLLAPLGALSFGWALALWVILGLGGFLFAGARLASGRWSMALMLMALAPAAVLAAIVGQSVLLGAALLVLGITELPRRPRLAGALLALAAAIKPQVALLAPLALFAGGAIEALLSAAVVEAVLVAASMVLFGPARWSEWLASLPAFQAVIEATPGLAPGVITPGGAAHLLGLTGVVSAVWRASFALFGIAVVWRAFRSTQGAAHRLACLTGGTLLATPYAMHYDGALLVPAAVVLVLEPIETPAWALRLLALCVVLMVTTPYLGLVCLLAFTVFGVIRAPAPTLAPAGPARPVAVRT